MALLKQKQVDSLVTDLGAKLAKGGGTMTGFITLHADPDAAMKAATKQYVDGLVSGLLDYRGAYDASGNVYPTTGGSGASGVIMQGDMWIISVAGTMGTVAVTTGDSVIANTDTPGDADANWNVLNSNITYVPEDVANKVTSISGSSTDVEYGSAKLLYDQLVLKQATLVSATNIKTVNSVTLLGAGNLAVGDMLLGTAQSVTEAKTFTKGKLLVKGTSSGVTDITTANASATDYAATLQAADGTIAYLTDITGTNSGTNTGDDKTAITGILKGAAGSIGAAAKGDADLILPDQSGKTGLFLSSNGTIASWSASGIGDMVLASIQSVTGKKTYDATKFAMKGSSTGVTTLDSANDGADNYTATLQKATGTIAYTSDITGTNSGTNTGDSQTLAAGVSDVTATKDEVNLLDLAGLTAGFVLSADTATTASWKAQAVTVIAEEDETCPVTVASTNFDITLTTAPTGGIAGIVSISINGLEASAAELVSVSTTTVTLNVPYAVDSTDIVAVRYF